MKDLCPGLHPRRLATLMHVAIARCQFDLSGSVVLLGAVVVAVGGGVGVAICLLDRAGVKELTPSLFRFVRVVRENFQPV